MKSSKKLFNSKFKKTKKIGKKQKGGLSLCPKIEKELQFTKEVFYRILKIVKRLCRLFKACFHPHYHLLRIR